MGGGQQGQLRRRGTAARGKGGKGGDEGGPSSSSSSPKNAVPEYWKIKMIVEANFMLEKALMQI